MKYIFPACHFVGGNYWVIKTTNQNRGIGVYVFKTIKQLQKILDQYMTKTVLEDGAETITVPKSQQFVIQKYIEKPFLINGRKFDIRVWVLVT